MPSRTETEIPATGRRGIYLLTHPRSASNLFQTMMSKQPDVSHFGYQMFDASFATLMSLDQGPLSHRAEPEKRAMYASYEDGWAKMQQELAIAKEMVCLSVYHKFADKQSGSGSSK